MHRVVRVASEIRIDGVLDEPAWDQALALELDYEVRPGENVPPPVRTVCLLAYDDRHLYVGFRAYDPEPDRIRARLSDRDRAWDDDWVGVALDTFNDERRAYELLSNPLGVQSDAVNDDVTGNYDTSWNAIWDSAGRITDRGYDVEMAIPFHQIRFQSAEGEQVWGFDAFRSWPREHRHHIGVFPRDRSNTSYLAQTVKLVGMEGASPGKNLEIVPTATGSRVEERDDVPEGPLEATDSGAELGVTVRWGFTPNASLSGALNPDFSQVEADALRVDINEPFALFFPETRPFFLEGADYFRTPLDLVHTRNVVDPDGALKVTGKEGRHTFGVFSARDESTSLIFPGSEGSSSAHFDLPTTASVARYRFDFGRSSTVGATLTDRRGADYYNSVASADGVVRFTDSDRLRFNAAWSSTRYDPSMVESEGVRDDEFGDRALAAEFSHEVRNWWVNASWQDFGEGFRSDLGFRPQVDFRMWTAAGARVWWSDGERFYNRMAWGGEVDRTARQDGQLLEEEIETWWNLSGPRQSELNVNAGVRNRWYDGRQYDGQRFASFWGEMQAHEDLRIWFGVVLGDWIDFADNRPADRLVLEPGLRWNMGRHLLVEYVHTYSSLDVEGGRLFRFHAPEIRTVYQFNTRSFVRAIVQFVDVRRNPALYLDDPPDAESQDLYGEILFSYKVNPQTALYLGYTDEYVGSESYDLARSRRSAFFKVGYAWVP